MYQVTSGHTKIGRATLTRTEGAAGLTTYVHHSRLRAAREGVEGERLLHEEVRVRDGLFEAAWAVREVGGHRTTVRAWWDADAGVVRVRRDGAETTVAPPGGGPLETLFDAPRRLVRHGLAGARRAVFDLPAGEVGWVVLRAPADAEGWAVTEELGVRVRSRWSPGASLPDALDLPDVGLRYVAVGVEVGPAAASPEPGEGGAVRVDGTPEPGARVRLRPAAAWEGLGCAGDVARLTAAGPACGPPASPAPAGAPPAAPGPRVRALAARLASAPAPERAARLAAEVAARLDARPTPAALWEADPEQALALGAGDCNEAAAVFAAAAPLLDLEVRRRTGLVLDPATGAFVPHAWVEVRQGDGWVRVDPSRGQAPATGLYLDLGDGERTADRLRAVVAAFRGGRVEILAE